VPLDDRPLPWLDGLSAGPTVLVSSGRRAFGEMPGFVSYIKSKVHRMRKGGKFAKLAIGRVIEAVQSHFDALLKISLEKRFPIFIGAVDF
jgi:hypothetical protein